MLDGPSGYILPPPAKVQIYVALVFNPVWELTGFTTESLPTGTPDNEYTFATLTISASRLSTGIIVRLAVPIMMLMLLGKWDCIYMCM